MVTCFIKLNSEVRHALLFNITIFAFKARSKLVTWSHMSEILFNISPFLSYCASSNGNVKIVACIMFLCLNSLLISWVYYKLDFNPNFQTSVQLPKEN